MSPMSLACALIEKGKGLLPFLSVVTPFPYYFLLSRASDIGDTRHIGVSGAIFRFSVSKPLDKRFGDRHIQGTHKRAARERSPISPKRPRLSPNRAARLCTNQRTHEVNVFYTNESPRVAASALDDLRLNKMIVESAQILSTARAINGTWHDGFYKPTHKGHPCVLWAAKSANNRRWVWEHAMEMLRLRGKPHKTRDVLVALEEAGDASEHTAPANCTDFKSLPLIHAYREQMRSKWAADKRAPKWTYGNKPDWAE